MRGLACDALYVLIADLVFSHRVTQNHFALLPEMFYR